ncbi:MAG: polyprenyl synthetase family protein [Polyangiaceae bacterium]|nr:polyprenyl synthetase family protein [Polyangiaceae bacterium]
MDSVVVREAKKSNEVDAQGTREVLGSLTRACDARGMNGLTDRLADINRWLEQDLTDVEREIAHVAKGGDTLAEKSARHLLDRGGKRLRPICVALASRMGSGFNPAARTFAIAVELVHNATLLHDDVVDLGDMRRGAPAARVIYGNAASIFGGDWLLVEALTRVQAANVPGVLDRALAVIREMVIAEAWQLERRGRVGATAREYFEIARGKTASLFRWAMFAGARAGGTTDDVCAALEEYGTHLGLAFQIVDDVLDFDGEAAELGKSLFIDLREGKMTYPLIVAMQKSSELFPLLEEVCRDSEVTLSPDLAKRIHTIVQNTGATRISLELAQEMCTEATNCLSRLPTGRARDALAQVALAIPQRRK